MVEKGGSQIGSYEIENEETKEIHENRFMTG